MYKTVLLFLYFPIFCILCKGYCTCYSLPKTQNTKNLLLATLNLKFHAFISVCFGTERTRERNNWEGATTIATGQGGYCQQAGVPYFRRVNL